MRLVSFVADGGVQAGVRFESVAVPVASINEACQTHFATDVWGLIQLGQLEELAAVIADGQALQNGVQIPLSDLQLAPIYRHPRRIWGIGLNYREHAGDLQAVHPTEEPASFMKADTTVVGPGEPIVLPPQSQRVTAEAELCVVLGKTCRDVDVREVDRSIAGYAAVIDMTAEDILQRNPRFLTRSKNFDTFLSLGAELVTPDEVDDVGGLRVGTFRNGALHRQNEVRNMTFSPAHLVAFHSQVMTWQAGDLLLTGTPGAVVIEDGDEAECRIDGMLPLKNPVTRRRA
ncbi:MAG: fumarylacetoacetate hydrolase family protein [Alicyclobacillus mali]|uniref:fumarylacetoacetate hydrolase family protein n=1 Tax=Alicyclobacillus mali (ex Roth et al. 2021) TaxID=1123961 RepID=UPI0023F33962|nr:fumarylacetoacetate hydrolase family protein [Alicyclobacillus mali (ex Roth et al. 2021)]MCL6487376.1 fumarylacetoacetate hydrolase family protein [Alicyclobacillus mali (ex Roth et al. 2021)]